MLSELYNGTFRPCEKIVPKSERYTNAEKEVSRLRAELAERLSPSDFSLLDELEKQLLIAQCEENEENFKYGFSAGVKLMIEITERR